MPPQWPPPTVHSLAAVGPLAGENNYQHPQLRCKRGRFLRPIHFWIGRRKNPAKHDHQVVTDLRLAAIDLRTAWLAMNPTQRASWQPFAKRWRLHLYFAYTKYNFARVLRHEALVVEP